MGNTLSFNHILSPQDLANVTVVVTGCDTGFGNEVTLTLLKDGIHVVSGCYTDQGIQNLKSEVDGNKGKYRGKLHAFKLDVTSDESVEAFRVKVEEVVPEGIYALINNAGIAGKGPVELLPFASHKAIMEVNYFGGLRMMRALLPSLRRFTRTLPRRIQPRIVNIASVAGRVICPGLAAYSASKHAFKALTEAMRIELRPFGIHVSLVEPGFASTPMVLADPKTEIKALETQFSKASEEVKVAYGVNTLVKGRNLAGRVTDKTTTVGTSITTMKPKQVVDCLVDAVKRKRPEVRYVVGAVAYFIILVQAIFPPWFLDAIMSKATNLH
ncbi:hypothetical protein HDU97_000726 [Phlyctochytrium planicorne]|nr:hypothetical protein HDU97_000726 [Phlyctochytrium planicorne]